MSEIDERRITRMRADNWTLEALKHPNAFLVFDDTCVEIPLPVTHVDIKRIQVI